MRAFLELLDQDVNRLAYAQYIPRSVVRFAPRAVLEAIKFGGLCHGRPFA
jgi:hypothetical protein